MAAGAARAVGTDVIEVRCWRGDAYRTLGTLGMIGAPALAASIVLAKLGWIRYLDPADSLCGVIYAGGWICTMLGLQRLGILGKDTLAKCVFALQMAALVLAALSCILLLADPVDAGLLYRMSDLAWPASHAVMFAVGVAALRARIWTGWRRFAPLACGSAWIAAIAAGEIAGYGAMEWTFGLYTACAGVLLAYAVRTGRRGFRLRILRSSPGQEAVKPAWERDSRPSPARALPRTVKVSSAVLKPWQDRPGA